MLRPTRFWPLGFVSTRGLAVAAGAALIASAPAGGVPIYVDDGAVAGGNGSSWVNAFRFLTDAAAFASIPANNVTEIRVAQGTYKPDRSSASPGGSGDRTAAFSLISGLIYQGGYAGPGTASPDAIDPDLFPTILSGDLAGNDGPNFVNNAENSHQIVRNAGFNGTAAMDGFIITAANGNGPNPFNSGGGVSLDDNNPTGPITISRCVFHTNSSFGGGGLFIRRGDAHLVDCRFVGNRAVGNGGGVYVTTAAPEFTRCAFQGNTATEAGGGMYMITAVGSMTFPDCTWTGNTAARSGGGMHYSDPNNTNLTLSWRSCEFRDNQSSGGGFGFGGGLFASGSRFNLVDCRLIGNSAARSGGGAWMDPTSFFSEARAALINCDFRGNDSLELGGGCFIQSGSASLFENCAFVGNAAASGGGGLHATGASNSRITNCTFASNSTPASTGGLVISGNGAVVANSIFWGNSDGGGSGQPAQIAVQSGIIQWNACRVQGWTGALPGTASSGVNPMLADADGLDGIAGNDDDDVRLQAESPAIDAGINAAPAPDQFDLDADANVIEPTPLDLAGNTRFIDEPSVTDSGTGTAPIIDIGAHEFGDPPVEAHYVGASGGSWFGAANWSTGAVPDDSTTVFLAANVVIQSAGAMAGNVILNSGTLTITDAGTLAASSIVIAPGANLSLNSASAELITHSLAVGDVIGLNWSAGTLRIVEGAVNHPGSLLVGCAGTAALILEDGATVNSPQLSLCANGTLAGQGTVAATVVNSGLVRPGWPIGRLNVAGTYAQTSTGAIEFELAGFTPQQDYDSLFVTGNVTLNGSALVTLEAGFLAELDVDHELIRGNVVDGSFASQQIPSLPAPIAMTAHQTPFLFGLSTMVTQTGARLFVDAASTGSGDAQSWSTAARSIDAAMAVAAAFPSAVREIWVAQGTYLPRTRSNPSDPTSARILLVDGVSLYGGFVGSETNLQQSDPAAHPTILTGDVLGDDGLDFSHYEDNLVNVVRAQGGNPFEHPTVLQGFTITGSQQRAVVFQTADPTLRQCIITRSNGGGMQLGATAAIEDCLFLDNRCFGGGAGLLVNDFFIHPVIRNCRFESNWARGDRGDGGGMQSLANSVEIVGCTFIGNISESVSDGGGGLDCEDDCRVVNCLFLGNRTRGHGGGLRFDGGPDAFVANCVFSGNTAGLGFPFSNNQNGGAIYIVSPDHPVIANCTMANNQAARFGGGLHSQNSLATASIFNCIFWGNSELAGTGETAQINGPGVLAFSHCTVQGWTGALGGVGNNGLDPLFADADGADNQPGTLDDNLRLQAGSPCIDSGRNAVTPMDLADLDQDQVTFQEQLPRDLDFNVRFHDVAAVPDTGAGASPLIDRGPYEFGAPDSESGLYVGPGGSWQVASSWAGGALPGPGTAVSIAATVTIDSFAATAGNVVLFPGAHLIISDGSLTCGNVFVASGAVLTLDSAKAALLVNNIYVMPGGTLDWSAGAITVQGGVLQVPDQLSIGCEHAASLHLAQGATLDADQAVLCAAGWLGGQGTVACSLTKGGTVSPGSSTGSITIEGDYTQTAGGQLLIEAVGLSAGAEFDQLQISGAASLDGDLVVTILSGFQPQLGQMDFLRASTVNGAFASVSLPELSGGFAAHLTYSASSASLMVIPPGPRLYVNAAAASVGAATSWAAAINDLQLVLAAASLSSGRILEIWVAQGTYVPQFPLDASGTHPARSATFALPGGATVYGGFAGTEASIEERDIEAHPTILSGDLLGNDPPGPAQDGIIGFEDNAYHVVTVAGTSRVSTLDGLTVRKGNASGSLDVDQQGGGILCDKAELILIQCTLTSNRAVRGAGLCSLGGSVTLAGCTMIGNGDFSMTGQRGGGVAIVGGMADLSDCLFQHNVAHEGGAGLSAEAEASVQMFSCQFTLNTADHHGAGMHSANSLIFLAQCTFQNNDLLEDIGGGGLEILNGIAVLEGCLFNENSAVLGGGVAVYTGLESLNLTTLTDCTFSGNRATSLGGGLYSFKSSPILNHCTFIDNTAALRGGGMHCEIFTTDLNDPILTDCLFEGNAVTADNAFGGGGFSSINGSPALVNCQFVDNSSSTQGGGLRNQQEFEESISLQGCTFTGNTASLGSGVYTRGRIHGQATLLEEDEFVSVGSVFPSHGSPNPLVGHLSINGAYRQLDPGPTDSTSPQLHIDLGGASLSDFDRVTAGEVELAGRLVVNLIRNFTPREGQSFSIMNTQAIAGAFDIAQFPQTKPGTVWAVHQDSSGIFIQLEPYVSQVAYQEPEFLVLGGLPRAAVQADFDRDGDLDIAVVLAAPGGSGPGLVIALINQGAEDPDRWNGFVMADLAVPVGSDPVDIAAGHFNADASIDLAVANRGSDNVSILLNSGLAALPFFTSSSVAAGQSPAALAAGFINSGTTTDLAVASSGQATLLFNNGEGSFSSASVPMGASPDDVALIDVNDDGMNDLLIADQGSSGPDSTLILRLATKPGAFAPPITYDLPDGPHSLEAADLNNDGLLDVLSTNRSSGTLSILVNTGDSESPLTAPIDIDAGPQPRSPALLDAESDGDLDVAFIGGVDPGDAVIRLLRNDLNDGVVLILSEVVDISSGEPSVCLLQGDLNGDGLADLVSVNGALEGVAGGFQSSSIATLLGLSNQSLPADLDHNGVVNGIDLGILLSQWASDGNADLNGDDVVNGVDLGILLANWTL